MANLPRACTRCKAIEREAFAESGVVIPPLPEWLPCADCDEPTCTEHGRDYGFGGWEHPECHEAPDYTRIEE